MFLLPTAASHGYLEICQLIIGQTHNKNPKDENETTPLHYAAYHGHSEVYRFILQSIEQQYDRHGNNTRNPQDSWGFTPLKLARRNGKYDQIFEIFQNSKRTDTAQSGNPKIRKMH